MFDEWVFKVFRVGLILLVLLAVLFIGRVGYDIYREQSEFEELKRKTNLAPNAPIQ